MEDDPDTPRDATPPPHERRDAAARAGDLQRMSAEADDATYGSTPEGRTIVPGVLSGDVGPKGTVASQLRSLSRRERSSYGEVPPGSVSPGGFWMLLLPMLAVAALLIGVVVLLGWLLS
ncbi:MAG: hypothetical protein JWM86_2938 [Thermoleophilia bacterium]|nr:hypothetical protein [Thermoleophilia bacterium]